jgi:hypothetical protein
MEMVESGLDNLMAVSSFTTKPAFLDRKKLFFNLKAIYQDENVFILVQKQNDLSLWARSGDGGTCQVNRLSGQLFHDNILKILVDIKNNVLILVGSASWLYLIDLYSFTMIHRKKLPNLKDANLIYDNSTEKNSKLMGIFESDEKSIRFLDSSTFSIMSNLTEFPVTSSLYFPPDYINYVLCIEDNGKFNLVSLQESDSMSVITRLIKEGKHNDAVSYLSQKSDDGLSSMEHYYQLCLELNCHPKSINDTLSHIVEPKMLKSFASNYDFVEPKYATAQKPSSLQIIDMVLKRFSSLECSQAVEDVKKDLKKITDRFITFLMIDVKKRNFWGNDWHIFRTCNMQYSLQNAIASKDISTALLLIKRHFKGKE